MPDGSRLSRVLPNLDAIVRDEHERRGRDVIAGLTVAAYLVPQVMGYSQLAGLPAVAGLWAITVSLALYALVGSSRQLSVGPESTTALMTAAIVAPMAAGDPARYATLAAALAIIVGIVALVAWAARLGFLADLLSKPVLVGYMAGVAVVMIVGQLGKLGRIDVEGTSTLDQLQSFARVVDDTHFPTLVLSAAVLAFLLVGTRWWPTAPIPLVAVLLSTLAVALFSLDERGIAVVGDIPRGFPAPRLPEIAWRDVVGMIVPAAGIAVVGYSDNMLTGRAFASRHREKIDANREWLALGVANIGAGFARGLPVSSSGSRTAIGDAMKSRTQLHSLVAVAVILAVLLFAGPVLERFPVAALGAIVVYAALRLIDSAAFARLFTLRRSEFLIAAITLIGVVAAGALYGVGIAVSMSIIELIRRVARPHDGILGYVPNMAGMHDVDDYATAQLVPGLLVYRYDAPLFFVNAEDFLQRALASVEHIDNGSSTTEWFVLNAEANVDMDMTAIDALNSLHDELARRDIVFAMARVKHHLFVQLDAEGIVDRVGHDRIFATLPTAVAAYAEWYRARHGSPPAGLVLGTVSPPGPQAGPTPGPPPSTPPGGAGESGTGA